MEFTTGYLLSTSGNKWNHFIFYWKFGEYQIHSVTYMAPETYFLSILPLFFLYIQTHKWYPKQPKYAQILGKSTDNSPCNFEILTNVTSCYLGHTLPMREVHHLTDAYPLTSQINQKNLHHFRSSQKGALIPEPYRQCFGASKPGGLGAGRPSQIRTCLPEGFKSFNTSFHKWVMWIKDGRASPCESVLFHFFTPLPENSMTPILQKIPLQLSKNCASTFRIR